MSTPIQSWPVLDAHQLRMVAEFASSRRRVGGDPLYAVTDPESGVAGAENTLYFVSSLTEGQVPRFEIDTREVEMRPKVTKVTFAVEGETLTDNLADAYDAVFWSEAAVEKFVLPYYASKSLWEAAAVLDKLSMYWYGQIPPDTDMGEGFPSPVQFLVDPPFAIAHTPDSDYTSLESDLHLLFTEGAVVRAHRLSDLPDLPASAGRAGRGQRTPAATGAA
ncbi:MAG TPA: hypothetical protein VF584_16090 [Longimicrobium sp.]